MELWGPTARPGLCLNDVAGDATITSSASTGNLGRAAKLEIVGTRFQPTHSASVVLKGRLCLPVIEPHRAFPGFHTTQALDALSDSF